MTIATLLTQIWLAANLFLQIGSVPIWVPLTIILLIILLFWWGLTRNRIPEENEIAGEQDAIEEELETVDEMPVPEVVDEDAEDELAPIIVEEEPSPAEEEIPPVSTEPDDLKVIEGIGPKISEILAGAGISTYAELAAADPEQLNKIVRVDAGIRVANPTSWPEQASLAASGDWDGLEELQNRLVAGRHRS